MIHLVVLRWLVLRIESLWGLSHHYYWRRWIGRICLASIWIEYINHMEGLFLGWSENEFYLRPCVVIIHEHILLWAIELVIFTMWLFQGHTRFYFMDLNNTLFSSNQIHLKIIITIIDFDHYIYSTSYVLNFCAYSHLKSFVIIFHAYFHLI